MDTEKGLSSAVFAFNPQTDNALHGGGLFYYEVLVSFFNGSFRQRSLIISQHIMALTSRLKRCG
jgi:hypothetical protein